MAYSKDCVLLYDQIYTRMKNYQEEASKIEACIRAAHPAAKTILDVACGTAEHARHLKAHYRLDGLDFNEDFLELARAKNPECEYFLGDMTNFELRGKYDVVMTLFSSIGYVVTEDRLVAALSRFASHLNSCGIVIVEPWLTPDTWSPGKPYMITIDEPGFKVCRMNVTELREGASYFEWNFLVAKQGELKYFTEEHRLGLFTVEQMKAAFKKAGMEVEYDPKGIFGRGLYTGRLA